MQRNLVQVHLDLSRRLGPFVKLTREATGEDCFRTEKVLSSLKDSSYKPFSFSEENRPLECLYKGQTDRPPSGRPQPPLPHKGATCPASRPGSTPRPTASTWSWRPGSRTTLGSSSRTTSQTDARLGRMRLSPLTCFTRLLSGSSSVESGKLQWRSRLFSRHPTTRRLRTRTPGRGGAGLPPTPCSSSTR